MSEKQTDLEQILQRGDRVEFRRYLKSATSHEVLLAGQLGNRIQDFQRLALDELLRRDDIVKMHSGGGEP